MICIYYYYCYYLYIYIYIFKVFIATFFLIFDLHKIFLTVNDTDEEDEKYIAESDLVHSLAFVKTHYYILEEFNHSNYKESYIKRNL